MPEETSFKSWHDIRSDVIRIASDGNLLPFFGAALSLFRPTSLPLGPGLLQAAIQGVFPERNLFAGEENRWSEEETAILKRSAEVVLQGLSEGLLDRTILAVFYNQMCGILPNPLHHFMVDALGHGKVPAIFTTNQDRCLEDAAQIQGRKLEPIFDTPGFEQGLQQNVFQFHGAIGGSTQDEVERRVNSLTFTLNSMGPKLPAAKEEVFVQALNQCSLLFLGYSGSDPDIWYSLHDFLKKSPEIRVYWCIRSKPSKHLLRLYRQNPNAIEIFVGDMVEVLLDLADSWEVTRPEHVEAPTEDEQNTRLRRLREWMPKLEQERRELAFNWLLASVGKCSIAAESLEEMALQTQTVGEDGRRMYMLAHLFAGFARREISDHKTTQAHLRIAADISAELDRHRYAQAMHKLGESMSAFERVQFWYFWPQQPRIHEGARWLNQAIAEYREIRNTNPEKLLTQQLGSSGLGNAVMNLGQLYRRVAAYTPHLRPRLLKRAAETLNEAESIIADEGDMRSLGMAIAANTADDSRRSRQQKLDDLNRAIELAEHWNQNDIQIGSANFAKAQFLANDDPRESERCYLRALDAFRDAGMKAEIIRTALDLAGLLARQARQVLNKAEVTWEWRFGIRVLGAMKAVRALLLNEVALSSIVLLLIFIFLMYRR